MIFENKFWDANEFFCAFVMKGSLGRAQKVAGFIFPGSLCSLWQENLWDALC